MDIQGYFTKKGLALSAKLVTGALLTNTKVVAGAGQTTDHMAATSLSQPKQALAVNSPTRSGNTATIPVTLAAAQAEEDYTLTELGVYAQDPDEGEILYKLYRLDTLVDITAGSRLVLRFYLEETVSQDVYVTVNCSPDGLVTEAAFLPVREKVLTPAVPARTVTVAAEDLKAYLDSLPRLLTEYLTLSVSGTVTEPLELNGFYGSGTIMIDGGMLGNCTVENIVGISDCSANIYLSNLAFTDGGKAADSYYQAVVQVNGSRWVYLKNCSFIGTKSERAVLFINSSNGALHDSTLQGFESAVCPWGTCVVSLRNVTGSDNTLGVHSYAGGVVMLSGTTETLLGGASNYLNGCLIVREDGTVA